MLSHRCLPQCSSPVVLVSSGVVKKSATVQLASQCRHSLACRASSNGSSVKASREEGSTSTPPVFEDSTEGIVCYISKEGEVTCEGWDEGGHFQPEPQNQFTLRKRKTTPRAVQSRGEVVENTVFEPKGGKMEDSIREGEAERSFNSSEL